ncbi:hypothetical protein IC232_03550 [Microvirga sp. BT688]|uniref:hypothetical protein n=1 Tax=Microvirga sp. TaxID=1873136 RepID=UPI00168301A9|nr:hypothetical protein [Microvirga sp.]MBD2745765.1 hypothetical protein [Microvirga sp.]
MAANDKEDRGRAQAFLKALYRAANPVGFEPPPDDFNGKEGLRLISDRGTEPAFGTPAYLDGVLKAVGRFDQMSPAAIVSVYVAQDSRALKEQLDWIREYRRRERRDVSSQQFDAERRRSLLEKVALLRTRYFWSETAKSKPYVGFSIFNVLDVPMTGVEVSVDLINRKGEVVAFGRVRHEPPIALAPGVQTVMEVDLTRVPALADPALAPMARELTARIKVDNLYVGRGEALIRPGGFDGSALAARMEAVGDLEVRIQEARDNLRVYRMLFPEIEANDGSMERSS